MNILKNLFSILRVKPLATRAEAIAACADVAKDTLMRDCVILQQDAEIQAITDRHAATLAQLAASIDGDTKLILRWAKDHREAEFDGKQTLVLPGGHELAFRKGKGAVKPREGLEEEDAIHAILQAEGDDADQLREDLLIVTPKINKEGVARYIRSGKGERIAALGLQLVVEEKLTFTPGRVEVPDSSASEIQ